jgi:gliding motility-associated-like protein
MNNYLQLLIFSFLLSFSSILIEEEAWVGARNIPTESSEVYLFEENKGQFKPFVYHRAQMGSKTLYIEETGMTWLFRNESDMQKSNDCKPHGSCSGKHDEHTIRKHAFRVHFDGGQVPRRIVNSDTSNFYKNYIRGAVSSQWASHVRNFRKVSLRSIYPGVDYEIFQTGRTLKYDFIVHSGADAQQIALKYEGVDTIFISNDELYIVTSIDTLIEKKPIAFQMKRGHRKYISCDFKVEGQTVRFELGPYDNNYPLTIDPELVFSTYSGSTGDNWGMTAAPAENEDAYGAGVSFEEGYPTTLGAFRTTFALGNGENETDIAVSRFSSDGTRLLYSTYIGGNGSEVPHSIIENNNGELVILGTTSSTDFPVLPNAFQRRFAGGNPLLGNLAINGIPYENGSDIIVAVLSNDGSNLSGSTFIGGAANDGINIGALEELAINYGDQLRGEVIVDRQNNIYVSSSTLSTDFPTSATAVQNNNRGGQDAVLFSLTPGCDVIRFSTYLGGERSEAGYSLKRRSDGGIYVVGGTTSLDYPVTAGALQTQYRDNIDGFIALFNANGSVLLSSSFIGTTGYDQVYLCALSYDDEIYITGQSDVGFPVTPNVFSVPNSGQFIQQLAPDLSAVELSTNFGSGSGEVDISPSAFMIDTCKRIFYSGWGGVTNNLGGRLASSTTDGLPITADAFQSTTDGSDFYFMVLEQDLTDLIYGSFFGRLDNISNTNDHVDGGTSRFDDKGIIYQAVCAGCGGFDDFPTTPRAWSRRNGTSSRCNLAVIKFDFQLSRLEASIDLELDTFGCAPYEAQFLNNSIGADEYFWDFGDGDTSRAFSPVNTYDSIGVYDVLFIASSNSSCLDPDTVELTIETILAEPPNSDTLLVCGEPFVDLTSSREGKDPRYIWNTGAQTRTFRAFSSGIYAVTATESNCVFVDSFDLTLINPSVRLEDEIFCGVEETDLVLDSRAENVVWQPTGETTTEINVTENNLYIANYSIDECDFVDSAAIGFAAIPEIEILGEDEACEGETVLLEIQNNSPATIETINWSSGQQTRTIEVTETGTYQVEVVSDSSCVFTTEKYVFIIPNLPPLNFPDSILLCRDSEYQVDLSEYAEAEADIQWNDGSGEPQRVFSDNGLYTVRISTECDLVEESFQLEFSPYKADDRPYHIPNVFTPNRDGINDIFRVEKAQEMDILDFEMKVFDRWGNMVFDSRDHEFGWNGRFKGPGMDPAVFAYLIRMDYFLCETPQSVKETGDITISK